MPRVACTSDWHLRPGDIFPKPFFAESEYYDGHPPDLVILNGDMRDFLPLGTKAWDTPEGHLTIQSLHSALEDYETVDLMGNHEGRFSWLKESNEGSHFISKREHTIKAKPLPYRFEHGHKLTEWWILRHIADDWTEWITTLPIFRAWWYKFCVQRGWLPSKYMHDWKGNPVPKYPSIVGLYWANAFRKAQQNKVNLVIGHSHCRAHLDTPHPRVPDIIDCGAREWTILRL